MLVQQTLDKMDAIGLTAQMAGFNPIGPGRFWAIAGSHGAHPPKSPFRTRAIQGTVGVGTNASEHQIWVWVPRRTVRNSSP